jgi:hypothetical protein
MLTLSQGGLLIIKNLGFLHTIRSNLSITVLKSNHVVTRISILLLTIQLMKWVSRDQVVESLIYQAFNRFKSFFKPSN